MLISSIIFWGTASLNLAVDTQDQVTHKAQPEHQVYLAQSEIQKNRKHAKDDIRDAARFSQLLNELQEAKRNRDQNALKKIDQKVMDALGREVKEEKREKKAAIREKNASLREKNRQKTKLNRSAKRGNEAAEARHSRALRDDKRDLEDDRADLARSRAELDETRKVRLAYKALLGKYDKQSLRQKEDLLRRLVALENKEIRRNQAEMSEDMQEKIEDAKEKRKKRKRRRLKQ
tara:strand:- start:165 stop:863 length:699 start_codon:yes stop_codon:yes gene_type:complete